MKRRRYVWLLGWIILSLLLLSVTGCQLAEVRSLEEDAIIKEGFRADQYVRDKWDTDIVPTYVENSYELRPLLERLSEDPAQIVQLGNQESQGSDWNFMVQSEAIILVFGNDRLFPEMELDLPPYDGETDVLLAMGPPITISMGFPIRDASGTIGFNEFINQEEHGAVANELLNRAQLEIAAALGVEDPRQIKDELQPQDFEGRSIRFYGAMRLVTDQDLSPENWSEIQVVPVELEVLD